MCGKCTAALEKLWNVSVQKSLSQCSNLTGGEYQPPETQRKYIYTSQQGTDVVIGYSVGISKGRGDKE